MSACSGNIWAVLFTSSTMQAVNGFLAKAGGKDKLTALIQVILLNHLGS